ncbi:MAG TPA: hypothetical protein VD948_12265 [Rhodothermales bacterium]|nr:hypothetical protein [Rhodothermales bacterium]
MVATAGKHDAPDHDHGHAHEQPETDVAEERTEPAHGASKRGCYGAGAATTSVQ